MSRQCMDGREGDADVGQYGFKTICGHSSTEHGSYALFGFLLLSHDEFGCQCDPGPWG